ncbi:MAG: 3-dehydroquinate synthase [Actinobacteria bacterium]|nr:3-dehydroquinate synthase [Actinomycetota bacterium]
MEEIQVRAASREYRVYVGEEALEEFLPGLVSRRGEGQVVVVSHPGILALHGDALDAALREGGHRGWEKRCFLFPEGEEWKRPSTVGALHALLLEWGVTRSGVILAFGGGVVGDLAGFAAATFMRGMDFIQLPTTLVAMVDSSVGGKVGVDMPGAKNAVGAFHQPEAVLCDPDLLSTLPRRELMGGLAEVLKYGFLYEPSLLSIRGGCEGWVRLTEWERTQAIARCVRLKAAVVEKDERDLSGERAMLNYGHTFGHALESATGYALLRHGEAVAAGMIMAARAAEALGTASPPLKELHRELLLPLLAEAPSLRGVTAEEVLAAMRSDKKRESRDRFVLLAGPQRPLLVEGPPWEVVGRAVEETLRELSDGREHGCSTTRETGR